MTIKYRASKCIIIIIQALFGACKISNFTHYDYMEAFT